MNNLDLNHFKSKLEKEKATLMEELGRVSRQDPDNPEDLMPTPEDIDTLRADRNEVADKLESFEGDVAIVSKLEPQLNDVKRALGKIEKGSYGTCEICGEPIKIERLEANPAARTCITHINEPLS